MISKIKRTFKPLYSNNFPELFKEIKDPWGYSTSGFERARFDIIFKFAQSVPHKNILEIGCAEGHLTEKLAKLSADITAIELSDAAIARAKIREPKTHFINTSFENYKPKKKEFDLIVCSEVLYYFKNKEEIIEKMRNCGHYLIVANTGIWHPILAKYFKNFKLLNSTVHLKPIEFKITTIALYRL